MNETDMLNKKLGITDELAKEINKYRLIKQEADLLNKSLKSYGYDVAKQLKYDRYVQLYENHLEYLQYKGLMNNLYGRMGMTEVLLGD